MIPIAITHQAFLDSLPDESGTKILLKTLLVGLIGGISTSIIIFVVLVSIKYDSRNLNNWNFLSAITAQDLPLFLVTLFIFYRRKFKSIIPQLSPTVSNKSFIPILAILLLNLLLGIGFGLLIFNNPSNIDRLKSYLNSGPNEITINYLFILFQSLIVFVVIAFFEEFIFRFTLFRFLRKKGLVFALLISSLLFTIFHGSSWSVQTILFGIIIALYYEYTNNFLGTIIVHALSNFLVVYYTHYLTYQILQYKLL